MSEYWVSKKKYFCKYCDIYIADDAPSRQQHENGLRHKGNVERFIRGLYKGSEKRKKDLDEEKRDMARVELAAQIAYAQDVASGRTKPMAAPLASTSSAPRKPPPKPLDPYAHYSTAASLGYSDPDAERFAAEMERRRTQGVAGDWEIVPLSSATSSETLESPSVDTTRKRGAELAVGEEDGREFKLRKKTLNVGLGEIYDPGIIIPVKPKKREITPPAVTDEPSVDTKTQKWTPVQRDLLSETATKEYGEDRALAGVDDLAPKVEKELATTDSSTNTVNAKPEEVAVPLLNADSSGSMFRKRKLRPSGNKGRT
ncbi:hypothetical protein L208DRAFT_572019 [Tricholoma matsutake]|nr:hypothetical protein L208DRAFT_572019 [Tricholoma matsutake 945]